MKYKVWFDSANLLVRAQVFESLIKEDAEGLMSEIERQLVDNDTRIGIMDLSEADSIRDVSKETRVVYREHAKKLPIDKAAVIVASPVIRMIARVAIAALGKSMKTRFVKSDDEALAWLKGEQP